MSRQISPDFVPDRQAAATEAQLAPLSRRRFIKNLFAVTASAVLLKGIDRGSGDILWQRDRTEIGYTYRPGFYRDSRSIWLVAGGYNVFDTRPIAGALTPSLSKTAPVGYINYAENGLSTNELGQSILDFANRHKINELNLYLHSMAGTIFVDTYTKIRHELALRSVAINNLLLDCSPYNVFDVKNDKREAAELMARLGNWWQDPGVISKFSIEAINKVSERLSRQTAFTAWQMLREAGRNATSGASPRTSQDELELLSTLPVYDNLFARVGQVCFIGPSNPQDDQTVDRDLAIAHWRKITGGNLQVILLDDIHHADPTRFASKYNQAINYYLWRQSNRPRGMN